MNKYFSLHIPVESSVSDNWLGPSIISIYGDDEKFKQKTLRIFIGDVVSRLLRSLFFFRLLEIFFFSGHRHFLVFCFKEAITPTTTTTIVE